MYNWLLYFFNFEYCDVIYDHVLLLNDPTYKIPFDNQYHLKIIDFSNDNWRNYKQLIRKKKLDILNSKIT